MKNLFKFLSPVLAISLMVSCEKPKESAKNQPSDNPPAAQPLHVTGHIYGLDGSNGPYRILYGVFKSGKPMPQACSGDMGQLVNNRDIDFILPESCNIGDEYAFFIEASAGTPDADKTFYALVPFQSLKNNASISINQISDYVFRQSATNCVQDSDKLKSGFDYLRDHKFGSDSYEQILIKNDNDAAAILDSYNTDLNRFCGTITSKK